MRSSILLVAPLLALVSISQPALAAPSPRDKAEARALVASAKKAMRERRFTDAVVALKKADRLDASPALSVSLAEALVASGKLVEAQQALAPVVGAPLPARTPADKNAREAARRMLDDLRARTPVVRVGIAGPAADGAVVLVDGRQVDPAGDSPVNPGVHTVRVEARGFAATERQVRLAEGGREQVTLELLPVRAEPVEAPKRAGSRVPGAVVTSIGAAGLVVGGIFGALAFKATSDAKGQCKGDVCPPSASDDVSRSKLYGNVSTGAFIGGGVVAAVGIGLLIAAPGGGAKSDDGRPSARVSPWVGPGAAGLGARGTF